MDTKCFEEGSDQRSVLYLFTQIQPESGTADAERARWRKQWRDVVARVGLNQAGHSNLCRRRRRRRQSGCSLHAVAFRCWCLRWYN